MLVVKATHIRVAYASYKIDKTQHNMQKSYGKMLLGLDFAEDMSYKFSHIVQKYEIK